MKQLSSWDSISQDTKVQRNNQNSVEIKEEESQKKEKRGVDLLFEGLKENSSTLRELYPHTYTYVSYMNIDLYGLPGKKLNMKNPRR